MKSHADAWKENLESKLKEVRATLMSYFTNKDDKSAGQFRTELTGLGAMFSSDQYPQTVRDMRNAFETLHANKQSPQFFAQALQAYFRLPTAAQFAETEPTTTSFDEIFASFASDGNLQALFDELVKVLQKILAEADDELSAQIARELSTILDQLKNREKKSLYELGMWADLGLRTLVKLSNTKAGTHGQESLSKGIEDAFNIKQRLMEFYGEAQKRLIADHAMSYVEQAIIQIPEMTNRDELEKRLLPVQAQIEKPTLSEQAQG